MHQFKINIYVIFLEYNVIQQYQNSLEESRKHFLLNDYYRVTTFQINRFVSSIRHLKGINVCIIILL